jgi:hypothetical protein
MIQRMAKDLISFIAFIFIVCMGFGVAYQGMMTFSICIHAHVQSAEGAAIDFNRPAISE